MQPFSNLESPILEEWLFCQAPLTDKLQLELGEAKLELLTQGWVHPSCWDMRNTSVGEDLVFQREILMRSTKSICWYARTLIPKHCFMLKPDFFNRLHHETMRELIYDEPLVTKINRTVYSVSPLKIEYHWAARYWPGLPLQLGVRFTEFFFAQTASFYLLELLSPMLGDRV